MPETTNKAPMSGNSDTRNAVENIKMSEKARETYSETEKAIVEKVAIELKKNGNIQKLARLGGESVELPQSDDEYRRIARELIQDRKFTFKDKEGKFVEEDGKKVEISIQKIDETRAQLIQGTPEEKRKEMLEQLGTLGSGSLDSKIPDSKRSAKIAQAVGDSVEENTGMFSFLGGATVMNAIIGLFQWIMNRFEGGFDGLKSSIAHVTTNSITKSTETRLREIGETPENIKEISEAVRIKALKEAGYPDKNAKTERLEDIKVPTPAASAPAPSQEPAQGTGASAPAQEGQNQNKTPPSTSAVTSPPTPAPTSGQEKSDIVPSASAAAVLSAASAAAVITVKGQGAQSQPAQPSQKRPVVAPAVDIAIIKPETSSPHQQPNRKSPAPVPSAASVTKTTEQPTVITSDYKAITAESTGLSGAALTVVQQIKSDTEKAISQPQPTQPANTAKAHNGSIPKTEHHEKEADKPKNKAEIKTAKKQHAPIVKAEEKGNNKHIASSPQPVVTTAAQEPPKPQQATIPATVTPTAPLVASAASATPVSKLEEKARGVAEEVLKKSGQAFTNENIKDFAKFFTVIAQNNSDKLQKPREMTEIILKELSNSNDPLAKKLRGDHSEIAIRVGLEGRIKEALSANKDDLLKADEADKLAGKKLGSLVDPSKEPVKLAFSKVPKDMVAFAPNGTGIAATSNSIS